MRTWENGKNPNYLIFCEFYLYQLDIVPRYHPIQFKGKLMNQPWENGEKPNFEPPLAQFGPNLTPLPKKNFRGFYLCCSYRLFQVTIISNFKKTWWTKFEKTAKNLISGRILARLAQIWATKIFLVGFTST